MYTSVAGSRQVRVEVSPARCVPSPCWAHGHRPFNSLIDNSPAACSRPQERLGSSLKRTFAKRISGTCRAAFDEKTVANNVSGKFRVIVAGGGIGGLVFSVAALAKGYDVTVLEQDLTAIRGEGKYRGPIQIQSNALATLEAIEQQMADDVLREGCITGDRINGLCDGLTGEWYCKFDTFHPAADRGIPVTRVISRMRLQELLVASCERIAGRSIIRNGVKVVSYENTADGVVAVLDNGEHVTGDLLVGSDGIYSRVRRQMVGETPCHYSGYTCYTGISDFCPPDIDTVGYRVFLGNGRYFVSSDVGDGKMQWYAFHKEPSGGTDTGPRKERLMELFGDWCDTVTDLIRATPEDDVLRRDIFDRAPVFQWVDGRVVLLGDAAHAMQPNLGQGGCMAIEDAFVLAEELEVARQASGAERPAERKLTEALKRYRERRMMRAAAIHGMARMAAYMASTYKTHLGEGMGPLQALTRLRIPHPGRMAGRIAMILSMPSVLAWVLGGFNGSVSHSRASACRLGDSPACLPLDREGFAALMGDDLRLLAAANCDWLLVPGSHAAHGSDTEFRPLSGKVVGTTGVLGRLQDAYQGPVDLFVINGRVSASGTGVPAATVERGAQGLFELKGGRRGVVVRSHVTGTTRIREGASIVLHPGDEVAAAEESTHDECLVMKTRHLTLRPKPASRSDRGTTVAGSYAYAARGDGMPGL